MKIRIKKSHPDALIPKYETKGAACFDLRAWLGKGIGVRFEKSFIFTTGLIFEIPLGHVMLIYSRSGHGFNKDIRLANCVGVIDSDYRGVVKIKLTNDNPYQDYMCIKHGDRIAQAMIIPLPDIDFIEATELSVTKRGSNGFGSTG